MPAPSDKPWVFVHLPSKPDEAPEFYVMTQKQLNFLLADAEKASMARYKDKWGKEYGDKPGVAAMTMKLASAFQDNWDDAILSRL